MNILYKDTDPIETIFLSNRLNASSILSESTLSQNAWLERSSVSLSYTILMSMIIEDTGEQFFIDNAKLSNVDGALCDLAFEDDIVFRGDKITELDYRGAEFEGKVTFDCDCFTSAFSGCIFYNDIIFTDNCKWCGSFKYVLIEGNITIPGGMFSIDISNFRFLFTEKTTYTGTKDEFLALVARSDIPDHMIDQAKKVVKFTKIDWEK